MKLRNIHLMNQLNVYYNSVLISLRFIFLNYSQSQFLFRINIYNKNLTFSQSKTELIFFIYQMRYLTPCGYDFEYIEIGDMRLKLGIYNMLDYIN